jgi:hypothetical protein
MAHFAKINENNIVIEVLAIDNNNAPDEITGIAFIESLGFTGNWKQTSYNTRGNINLNNGIAFRKNYAGVGFTYDEQRDAFIPPSPFPSWVLDEDTCLWQAPTTRPKATETTVWKWDEPSVSWVEIPRPVLPSE